MGYYDDKPWIDGYKLGSFDLAKTMQPYPETPLFSFFDNTAQRYPKRSACLYLGRKIPWEELKTHVDRLAAAFYDLGVERGDKVATILPTCPQFVISDYAIQKAGATHVPCSILHKSHDLVYEIGESGAEIVICLDSSLELVREVESRTSLKKIIVTAVEDFSPDEPELEEIPGAIPLRSLIAGYEPRPPEIEIDPREDLALLVFTGGATGKPKGVMLTHYSLAANTLQLLPWVLGPLEQGIRGKSSVLMGIPTFHAYGHAIMRGAVNWGLQMIMIPDPRDTEMIVKMMKRNRPFLAPLVPTQYMKLVDEKIGRTNVNFTSGAAPLPPEVTRIFKKQTGMPITEAYGLTETSPLTHFNLSSFAKITGFMPFEKLGSIGVPVVDTEARILDSASCEEVPPGEVGELYVRGPQLMKGYWPTQGDGLREGWLATGDLCRMDQDGYFYLVDRNKDMINVSGNKVYSTRVDEILFEHPAVGEAVTIGVPDLDRPGSERIKAFIVLRDDYADKTTADEIIAHCREKLAPYAVPRIIEFRGSLPRTVTEKLFKKQLRDEEVDKLG
ncbi:MAG: AMP-binding protein [Actinomycetota bacterium]|nr:AMP-binding protein [Actinomycetota bacterium]